MPLDPSLHVVELAVSPVFETDGTGFAATDAGPWTTADGGRTWEPAVPELAAGNIAATAVAVSPAFTSDGTALVAIPGGIGRSVDGGGTWQFMQLPLPAPVVSSIAMSPRFDSDGVVFLGTVQDGVFRSDDAGNTWVPWNSGLLDASVTALAVSPHFDDDQTLFAGTTTGVFRSTNGGRRWIATDFGQDSLATISMLGIVRTESGAIVIVAGTETGDLWCSNDVGKTWRRIERASSGAAMRAIATGSATAQIVVLTDDALLHSTDGGRTWSTVSDLDVPAEKIVTMAGCGSPDWKLIAVTASGELLRVPGG